MQKSILIRTPCGFGTEPPWSVCLLTFKILLPFPIFVLSSSVGTESYVNFKLSSYTDPDTNPYLVPKMDSSSIYHGADQDNNASQDHNMNMHVYPNIYATHYRLAFQQQLYEQQKLYGYNGPASVPEAKWSVFGVGISHQAPMKYLFRRDVDDFPESIIERIHMMLIAYIGAEQMPPESRALERTHAFYQFVRDHLLKVRGIYITDAEKAGAFACYAGLSEEELTKEPCLSMPKIGILLGNPPMPIYGWLRFFGVDVVLTDCKNPKKKQAETTGFYTTVLELEGDCAGARLLRLLTDNEAFSGLDIINLNITERFCAEDKNRPLDLYRSADFSMRAKHVNIKIRWDDVPFGVFEMDLYPELKGIICPQLRGLNNSTLGTWRMAYST